MEQSPSWEANRSSDRQEIPLTLWNPEVHYRIMQEPSTCPCLRDQSSPYSHPTFLKIHFNIILSSMRTIC
jgi:hypothetical protein